MCSGSILYCVAIISLTTFLPSASSDKAIFSLYNISQIPETCWNETISNIGTLFSCSQLCHKDTCLGFSWMKRPHFSCTLWNTEEKEPIFLGTPGNTVSIWLKNGRQSFVSRMVFLVRDTGAFIDYDPDQGSVSHEMAIPNLENVAGKEIIHQSFKWGFLVCCIFEKTCHQWIYGSDSWSSSSDLLKQHTLVRDQTGLVGNTLWVIGGRHSDTTVSFTEYLNTGGQWTLGPNLPKYRYVFGIAPAKGPYVLLAGGSNGSIWESEIQLYNVNQGTWMTVGHFDIPTIRTSCEKHSLINGTALVFCIGGKIVGTKTAKAGIYNIKSGSWTIRPEWDLPIACDEPKLQTVDGKLFVFGGNFDDGRMDRVLEFREDQIPVWQERASLPFDKGYMIPLKIPIWYPNQD